MRIIIAAVILATLAPLARADVETAKKAYEKGMTQYNLQKFNEALAMFQRAYEEKVDPAFLFNIAQCQRQLGQYDAAAKSYRAYLNSSPETPPNAEQVRALISEMDAAAQQKRAEQPPTGLSAPSPDSRTPATHADVAVVVSAPISAPWYKKKTGWVLAGTGVVAAVAGVGLVGAAVGEHNSAVSASTQKSFDDHHSNSVLFQQAGWPILGVGAALVVAGVVVFTLPKKVAR